MTGVFDYKKEHKDLYLPKTSPSLIDVPKMTFIMVDGRGNPNTSEEYKAAIEILYGLSYSIKMSKKSGTAPIGYFEYVIPPLEGLWWSEAGDIDGKIITDKDKFFWTSMIRQPEFVTQDVFESTKQALNKKKPWIDLSLARLESFTEGLCAQITHIGCYDDEPTTISVLERFIIENSYVNDVSENRNHHEIYLSDPRKTVPEKLKTVIRHPITRE